MFIENESLCFRTRTKAYVQEVQMKMKRGHIIRQNNKVEKLFILYYNLRYISTPFWNFMIIFYEKFEKDEKTVSTVCGKQTE